MNTAAVVAAVLGISLGFVAAQREPYPGQREHKEPPANYFCEHVSTNPARRCSCPGMQQDPMCKKPPNAAGEEEQPTAEESRKCFSWCWPAHCHCLKACDT